MSQFNGPKLNAMTVDVEDYFQVSAFENVLPREKWSMMPIRVHKSTEKILDLFELHGVKATFFILGWVAEKKPYLVRKIVDQGHEVASHGYWHRRLDLLSPDRFREDCLRSKQLLEDISGETVIGYRAPTYSLSPKTPWAHPILESLGFKYSSSIYPIKHDLYGWPDAPRFPYTATPGGMIEIPISTLNKWGRHWPCGGGGYFRLWPYRWSKWAMNQIIQHDNKPLVFYFHPWEIDPFQPKQSGISWKTQFRHYHNLDKTEARIKQLCQDFKWERMQYVFGQGTYDDQRSSDHQAA